MDPISGPLHSLHAAWLTVFLFEGTRSARQAGALVGVLDTLRDCTAAAAADPRRPRASESYQAVTHPVALPGAVWQPAGCAAAAASTPNLGSCNWFRGPDHSLSQSCLRLLLLRWVCTARADHKRASGSELARRQPDARGSLTVNRSTRAMEGRKVLLQEGRAWLREIHDLLHRNLHRGNPAFIYSIYSCSRKKGLFRYRIIPFCRVLSSDDTASTGVMRACANRFPLNTWLAYAS